MKIIQIVGARPQFIKYFAIERAIAGLNLNKSIRNILVHTGQHYDYGMSRVFFDELGINSPDYHLGVGFNKQGARVKTILRKTGAVLIKEKPDLVIVYGDTNSTLGGAIAAAKNRIPVAHIEAGLRSYNKNMPEEANRVEADRISSLLFCPDKVSVENLKKEGITHSNNCFPQVFNAGDVMYDILKLSTRIADKRSRVDKKLKLIKKRYCVLTIHRAENTDNPGVMNRLIDFVNGASKGRNVIFPVHPRNKKSFQKIRARLSDNIIMIDPVGYFDMLKLVKDSALVFTDSGGLQKEAYWLKVPCVTLRKETEWTETLKSGWNVLYGDYSGKHDLVNYDSTLYGDGHAARKIVKIIAKIFNVKPE